MAELAAYVDNFYHDGNHDHMVFPRMVHIFPLTEYGTLYTKEELTAISDVCRQYQLPLFSNGARLGYGLAAKETEVDLPTIAAVSDVFYIESSNLPADFPRLAVANRFYTYIIN